MTTKTKQPDNHYTYPSDKAYFDDKTSTATKLAPSDPAKTGKDYGIKDVEKVKEVPVG